jgi:hypothetical protein
MAARTISTAFTTVRRFALALPDVEEGTSWGAPAWRLRGKLMACAPTHKSAEPDSLVVLLDFAQRDELLAAEPDIYYLKEHYANYPCLLVRLQRIHPDALRDLLRMSWTYVVSKAKRKRPVRKAAKRAVTRAVIVLACVLGAAGRGEARQSADDIARRIVIGQAYVSGNVYAAGFTADEKRSWPHRITLVPLHEEAPLRIAADFFRTVTQDSEEQYYFPRRETTGELSDLDIFSTVDRMALEDRNLARYRADDRVQDSVALFGWDQRLPLAGISRRDRGQLRPTTAGERVEIAADKKRSAPKDFECTTVPQFLDSARVILTAAIADSNLSIRLSHFITPGCAGHLSAIYVLDVIAPGQEPRRFEFRHYHGVL